MTKKVQDFFWNYLRMELNMLEAQILIFGLCVFVLYKLGYGAGALFAYVL